jgi:hypothetical protein
MSIVLKEEVRLSCNVSVREMERIHNLWLSGQGLENIKIHLRT